MLAAQRITSNRSESKLTTFVAILGLLAALAGAFIRTWSNQLNNQTSHTIAVVSLFFIFIPIVWISSNIGAFTSPTVVIEIIQELRRNLKEHNDELKRDIEEYNDELQRKMENSSDELRRNLEKLNSGEPNDELQQSLTERNIELQCNLKEWNNELQRNSKTKAYLYSRQDLFPPLSLGKEFGWNGKEIDVVHKANESKFWHGLVTHIPFLGKLLSKHMSPTDSSASLIPGEESTNREVSEETQNLVMWPIVGAYLGMNSCWRPDKSLESTLESEHAGRSKLTLLVFPFVFVWGCSYVPALLLSYFTPLVGFACRSLAWTIIVGLWTLAPVLSLMFQAYVKSAKWLWFWTTVIDAINSLAIILIVFLAQVGVFNSCYCRSGALTGMTGDENYINLYPPTDEEFLASLWKWGIIPAVALIIMGSFLAIAGSGSYSAQALLNRDTSEKSGDTSAINQGRENLRFDKKSRCWQSIQQLGTSETTSTQQFIERPRGQNAQDQDGEDIEMGTISSYTDGALPY
ncbi:hypothetical protein BGZ60DRAFT_402523 [Tricladium varicosporioides]|nr:hypothetical protein BGZ60DRAFT_402523 [Hymenoscyphus varicosporioides]